MGCSVASEVRLGQQACEVRSSSGSLQVCSVLLSVYTVFICGNADAHS
jgi:hypothetical protein